MCKYLGIYFSFCLIFYTLLRNYALICIRKPTFVSTPCKILQYLEVVLTIALLEVAALRMVHIVQHFYQLFVSLLHSCFVYMFMNYPAVVIHQVTSASYSAIVVQLRRMVEDELAQYRVFILATSAAVQM